MNTRRHLTALALLVCVVLSLPTALDRRASMQLPTAQQDQRITAPAVVDAPQQIEDESDFWQNAWRSVPMGYFYVQLKTNWETIHQASLCCSMLFDWTFFLSGGSGCGYDMKHNTTEIRGLSSRSYEGLCRFLMACRIPFKTEAQSRPQSLPYVSNEARTYFVSRLFRTWRAVGFEPSVRPRYWDILLPDEAECRTLIRDYDGFSALFPQDRYLGAYAHLCSAILLLRSQVYKWHPSLAAAERFTQIEAAYPDLSEVGLMSCWWRAMYLAPHHPQEAKETFQHIANKYKDYDWWLVRVAARASKGTLRQWRRMGLIDKEGSNYYHVW